MVKDSTQDNVLDARSLMVMFASSMDCMLVSHVPPSRTWMSGTSLHRLLVEPSN